MSDFAFSCNGQFSANFTSIRKYQFSDKSLIRKREKDLQTDGQRERLAVRQRDGEREKEGEKLTLRQPGRQLLSQINRHSSVYFFFFFLSFFFGGGGGGGGGWLYTVNSNTFCSANGKLWTFNIHDASQESCVSLTDAETDCR